MKLFEPLYQRAIVFAQHRRAPWLLAFLSFIEAIIFPVPPEVMLAPMCLAQPKRSWRYATIALVAGVLGSILGYALGHFAYQLVAPLLSTGMQAEIADWVAKLQVMMQEHRTALIGALLLAAIQPVIPMKFVAWAAGIAGVPLAEFLLCMLIGRGKRLYLVAGAIRLGGEKAEAALRRNVELVGWATMLLLAGLVAWLYFRHQGA